jgi:hypothetical protein
MMRPITLAIATLAVAVAAACNRQTGLEQLAEARRVTADLQMHFTKAANAGNRAVMAHTDDMATASVREAQEATADAQKDADLLASLLDSLNYATEAQLLNTFRSHFAEYQKLDHKILKLAVENSNAKAQQLAFGPAQQAGNDFRVALGRVSAAAFADEWQVRALVATAVGAVREIQALQAPHIASPDDAAMTAMEREMAAAEAVARTTLATLRGRAASESRPRVAEATAALDQFVGVNKEILVLSRRNTDVRSLALSLNEKGELTAACEAALQQLRDALSKRGVMGAR